ncbi:MAG: (Fe-S)-binding protein, partial [Schwartzia sp.]|nr:(Fe-S)-binding protein [Schwartzia sp. (in: firmicutes)]
MKDISRRDFMKLGSMLAVGSMLSPLSGMGRALAQAPVVGSEDVTKGGGSGSKAKVYFTKHIDAPHL